MNLPQVPSRERAIDAADKLNDFIADFITGVMVFREYSAHHKQGKLPLELMVGIQKMCMSHLILAFAKFEEFWKHYHDVVPAEHRAACKAILREIRVRKITDFRNQVVGHIWNAKQARPLRHSEVMQALAFITASNFEAFLDWVNNPKRNQYPSTVVSVVEAVRNAITATRGLDPSEVINR